MYWLYFTISVLLTSGLIEGWPLILKGDNVPVVFYYLSDSEIWPDRGVAFGSEGGQFTGCILLSQCFWNLGIRCYVCMDDRLNGHFMSYSGKCLGSGITAIKSPFWAKHINDSMFIKDLLMCDVTSLWLHIRKQRYYVNIRLVAW